MKRILLLGNGGREHAIAKAILRSPQEKELYGFFSAHNPGIIELCTDFYITPEKNFGAENAWKTLMQKANEWDIDFAILGPDDPIAAGAADALKSIGILVFAPTQKCAQLESSKGFTRSLLEKYNISGNPGFKRFEGEKDIPALQEYIKHLPYKFVVKDDGLCGGKGVSVQDDHFANAEEGLQIAENILRNPHGALVIEEKLEGPEFSFMFFADGNTIIPMPTIADHKRAFDGDKGPNTGGMGTISFAEHLPFITKENMQEATEITEQVMRAVEKEVGEKFCGVMYGGFMRTKTGTKLIEYNARFGDPEALNALSLLESDLIEIIEHACLGTLSKISVSFAKKATVCKYIVPEGYPTNSIKDKEITIDFDKIPEGVEVYLASVYQKEGKLYLGGSRSVGVVGIDEDFFEAAQKAEKAIKAISGPVFWRKDIGTKELLEKRMQEVK